MQRPWRSTAKRCTGRNSSKEVFIMVRAEIGASYAALNALTTRVLFEMS